MTPYPPLTLRQLGELNATIIELHQQLDKIASQRFGGLQRPGDEDSFLGEISALRGALSNLDLKLYRQYQVVHKMKASNVPTFLAPPTSPAPRPTIDALGDFL